MRRHYVHSNNKYHMPAPRKRKRYSDFSAETGPRKINHWWKTGSERTHKKMPIEKGPKRTKYIRDYKRKQRATRLRKGLCTECNQPRYVELVKTKAGRTKKVVRTKCETHLRRQADAVFAKRNA